MKTYKELKLWRQQQINEVCNHPELLNQFHDKLIKETVQAAIKKNESEWGPIPARFAFFMMGSAGRYEQSVWSDQDHGIIFDGSEVLKDYFLTLGSEITRALYEVGYDLCDGNVMASNPLWCHSLTVWEQQILRWLNEESWESLRCFLTFFDSRVLIGEEWFLLKLKDVGFSKLDNNPHLYSRLLANVSHIRKAIGFFGQLLPDGHGEDVGSLNLKDQVFFPFVNAVRLLALKEKITEPSTLARIQLLPECYNQIKGYYDEFSELLQYRLYFQRFSTSYEKVHLLNLKKLTKQQKQELKRIMKNGYKLFSETKVIIEKGV
ncbi:DUF294 nucleotidyltransferase-like domain-containing protein [Bacillus sp. Marseille-P3661]|uniref:DUF294 nucleotidyltransferase-like domain-containing protein n=1 Tax=Bacillus sp. Marseille-P3661 TaxID=1936234 RepID=UPI002155CAF6|nr:DUF294 nucleotidyltransferase-like domain-containing protein [Bacillus sp. Marseille-P3661]